MVALRRKRVTQVLLAAAAVTVIGFGTSQVIGGMSGDDRDDSSGAADDTALESGASDEGSRQGTDSGGDSGGDSAPQGPAEGGAEAPARSLVLDPADLAELPVVRPSRLERDLTRLADTPTASLDQDFAAGADGDVPPAEVQCGPVFHAENERRVWVNLDNRLGLVMYYPTVEGLQQVDVFACDGPTPRRAVGSVLLPANR